MLFKSLFRAALICAVIAPLTASAPREGRMMVLDNVTDYYDFRLTLKVPVIIDNMESLGRRKYKNQQIVGSFAVHYSSDKDGDRQIDFAIPALTNRNYKIRGTNVTYETTLDNVTWVAIGSNRSNIFNVGSVAFSMDADPSYNVGDDEPDNTLVLTVAGYGKQFGAFRGFAAGQLGCGCRAYGHVSPTRQLGPQGATDKVQDIAACFGQFRMKWTGYEVD